MKTFRNAACAAVALSCLLVAPGAAAEREGNREPVTIRVSRAGLNLATAAGRGQFAKRVRRAALVACAPRDASLRLRADSMRCVQEMMDDATVRVALIAKDAGTELASTGR